MQKFESDTKNSENKAMKLVRYEIERNKNVLSSYDKTLAKVKMILQLLLGMALGLLAIYFYFGFTNRFDLFIALSPSWLILIIAISSVYNNSLSFNQQKEALKCENDFLGKKLIFYQE